MSHRDAHRLYVHLAWSTVARVEALDPARRAAIETHLLASCRWLGTDPIEACALPDRVHLLVRLPAVLSVHDLAVRVRADVERILADGGRVVRWAPGYAAATVAPRDVRRIRKRIVRLGWGAGTELPRRSSGLRPGTGAAALPSGRPRGSRPRGGNREEE